MRMQINELTGASHGGTIRRHHFRSCDTGAGDSMQDETLKIISDYLDIPVSDLRPERTLVDLGVDSIDCFELLFGPAAGRSPSIAGSTYLLGGCHIVVMCEFYPTNENLVWCSVSSRCLRCS